MTLRLFSAWLLALTLWTSASVAQPLQLRDVLQSTIESHPKLLAEVAKVAAAKGGAFAAEGAFDLKTYALGTYAPVGKYSKPRAEVGLKQPTSVWGAQLYAKYENGNDFAPYDGGLVTSEAGKVSLGLLLPLVQGRAIDANRFNQLQTNVEVVIAEQAWRSARADLLAAASIAWWKWAVTGRKLSVQRLLLTQAETRQQLLVEQTKVGAIADIEAVDNERLVAQRRAKLIALEWEFSQQSLQLGLYCRDAMGRPMRPGLERVPQEPLATFLPTVTLSTLLPLLESSPGARIYRKTIEALDAELRLAYNAQLPRLDVELFGARSFGDVRPYSVHDTSITETVVGGTLRWDLDIQRRKARGKAQALQAKRAALEHELRLFIETLRTHVEARHNALAAQHEVTQLNRAATGLTSRVTEAEAESFRHGQSSVLAVNLREQAQAAAYTSELESTLDFHVAWIELQRMLGKHELVDYLPKSLNPLFAETSPESRK